MTRNVKFILPENGHQNIMLIYFDVMPYKLLEF